MKNFCHNGPTTDSWIMKLPAPPTHEVQFGILLVLHHPVLVTGVLGKFIRRDTFSTSLQLIAFRFHGYRNPSKTTLHLKTP